MSSQILLLDDHRGVYIPRDFCQDFDFSDWGISDADAAICIAGPEHEQYWDAWNDILDSAEHVRTGHKLHQDGALFAWHPEYCTVAERKALFGETTEEDALIEELKNHGRVDKYVGESYLTPTDDADKADTFVLRDTVYGDYCGGFVQWANSNVLQEQHDWLGNRHEGYGSSMLYFTSSDRNLDASILDATPTQLQELLDTLNQLGSYPVLDDEEWSRLEQEAFNEAWEDWGREDFRKALQENVADTYEEELSRLILDDKWVDETFNGTAESIGEYWRQDAEGLTVHVDIDRVAQAYLDSKGLSAVA